MKPYTKLMFKEKIYLEDVLEITKQSLTYEGSKKASLFFVSVNYISDYFRNSHNPIFWLHKTFETEKKRDHFFNKLTKILKCKEKCFHNKMLHK